MIIFGETSKQIKFKHLLEKEIEFISDQCGCEGEIDWEKGDVLFTGCNKVRAFQMLFSRFKPNVVERM